MCFSAEADFTASAVLGAVGVATLLNVKEPRAALFAGLPLLFALHQFTEGFVWLGLGGRLAPQPTAAATLAFMFFAQALLPVVVPVAVGLMEPKGPRRVAIGATLLVGLGLFAWVSWALLNAPNSAAVEGRCIAFRNPVTNHPWTVALYAIPATLAPSLSSHRLVRAFGALSFLGMAAVLLVKAYALTSVWCLYVALLSGMLWFQFRRRPDGTAAADDFARA